MHFWVRRCLEIPSFSLLATSITSVFHAVSLEYPFREKYGLVDKMGTIRLGCPTTRLCGHRCNQCKEASGCQHR